MLRSTLEALLDSVYPPRCAACAEPLRSTADEPFCPPCSEAVDPVPDGCRRCGAPGLAPGGEPVCGGCAAEPPAFARVRAAALFGGPLGDAVHALKYGGRPALARPLGRWLAARVPLPPGATVAPVPLAPGRRLARGYDQAALLARWVARAAGAPLLRGALRRVRETPPQVGRSRAERARNVAGAFSASGSAAGRSIVLVDDVVTTGATADAAARALRAGGAACVEVIALGRAE